MQQQGMFSPMVMASKVLDRVLVMEMVRVTEAAAISASTLVGRGDEKAADAAAVEAMRAALNELAIDGTVVIGEGERDEAPMLFIGEKVGSAMHRPEDRHRARSARRHHLTAKAMPGAIACWRWQKKARCSMRLTSTWTSWRSARLSRRHHRPRSAGGENVRKRGQGQGRRSGGDHRAACSDRPRHAELIAAARHWRGCCV
jgi:fructose-1,6-bisphosphatase II / sedoheptulose-1,7-bisphosphatase